LVWVCFGQSLNLLNDLVYFLSSRGNCFLSRGLGDFP
jgi:hypothetical protein